MKRNVIITAAAVALVAGCATAPQVDWKSRVGNYTYEQAVAEMGPANNVIVLRDGSREGQWLIDRGAAPLIRQNLDARYTSPVYTDYGKREVPQRPRYLHLVFGPDGKLDAWGEDRPALVSAPVY